MQLAQGSAGRTEVHGDATSGTMRANSWTEMQAEAEAFAKAVDLVTTQTGRRLAEKQDQATVNATDPLRRFDTQGHGVKQPMERTNTYPMVGTCR